MTKYLLTFSFLLTFWNAQAQGPYYLYNEQFIEGDCGWTLNKNTYVHQGTLHLSAYLTRSNPKMINSVYISPKIETQKDFKIQTAFIHDWSSNGTMTNYFGLEFGQNEEGKGYGFYVTHEGEYYVALPDGSSVAWKPTPYMQKYVWNDLKIDKKGNTLRFILNDRVVYETEFQPFAGNRLSLKIGDKNNGSATRLRVDYLEVLQPTSPDYSEYLRDHNRLKAAFSGDSESQNNSISFKNRQGEIARRVQEEWERWAQKGEFETTTQYRERMTLKDSELERIAERVAGYFEVKYLDELRLVDYTLHRYDADAQTFKVTLDKAGDFNLYVPIEEAPAFKEAKNWLMFKNIDLTLKDNQWVVAYVEVQNIETKKTYTYDLTQTLDYNPEAYGLKLDKNQ